jgi:hypothetical protein
MVNIIISQEAIDFLLAKKRTDNLHLVIYRDIAKTCCWYNAKPLSFVIKAKVMRDKKPNEYFMMYDDSCGIPVWIEKGILKKLENEPILISLRNGFIKRLNLEIGSQLLESK